MSRQLIIEETDKGTKLIKNDFSNLETIGIIEGYKFNLLVKSPEQSFLKNLEMLKEHLPELFNNK